MKNRVKALGQAVASAARSVVKFFQEDKIAGWLFLGVVATVVVGLIVGLVRGDPNTIEPTALVALVLVTGLYGWHTRQIALANQRTTEETRQLVRLTNAQYIISFRPLLWFKFSSPSSADLDIANVGNGPAFHIHWLLEGGNPAIALQKGALTLEVLRAGESLPGEIRNTSFQGEAQLTCVYQDRAQNWFRTWVTLTYDSGTRRFMARGDQRFEPCYQKEPEEHTRAHS